jgi:hypothetical protein
MNDAVEHIADLRASQKFLEWKPSRFAPAKDGPLRPDDLNPALAEEKHYTPDELGELWAVSPQTIRNLFFDEPGVLRLPSRRTGKKARSYVSMKIPESVAERVHKKYSSVAA